MEDLKLIQKLRQRKNGVTAEELALGKQTTSRKIDVCTILTHSIQRLILFPSSQMILSD